jgi:hypothetical protein
MSVNRPNATDDVFKAMEGGLAAFLEDDDPLRKILTRVQRGQREEIQVFTITLEDLASGNWQKCEYKGWRFLAVDDDKNGVTVDVSAPINGRPPKVVGVQRGPHAAKTIDALRAVDAPPGVPATDLTLAFLSIPGLLTDMFWIRSKGGNGWTVAYRTLVKDFTRESSYTLQAFFNLAKPAAESRLRQHENLSTGL